MARPRKTVDWKQLDKLCALQATGEEIAAFFDMDYDTLNAICKRERDMGFSDYFAQKRTTGKISLRRAQLQTAINGNATMQIWLGKCWLGQQDSLVVDNTSSDGSMNFRDIADDILEILKKKHGDD